MFRLFCNWLHCGPNLWLSMTWYHKSIGKHKLLRLADSKAVLPTYTLNALNLFVDKLTIYFKLVSTNLD